MATPSSGLKDRTKSDMDNRKVRVIANIRAFTDLELESSKGISAKPWVSVHKPNGESSEKVTISFGDQPTTSRREVYEVDYCYEHHEDNFLIFSREIKPLIAGVFDGGNASVIAYGARGSGKTYTIQGCDEQPGLALLAMAEILSMAEERGNKVTISYYEVFQDHVYDILDPKRPVVLALEDAKGKIQLKGLSRVAVKSLSEFKKLYYSGCDLHKATQKIAFEPPQRSHKGLTLHVSSYDEYLKTHLVGKMNFVDMAGYEDARRKSTDDSNFADNARINKTLYALQNVVHALNAKESHVPYRESKLTRMLQDSLGGTSRILMVTCLNPSFCQDTVYMASLASRFYQGINRGVMDSAKKTRSVARPLVPSSSKKVVKPGTLSASVKKQTSSRLPLHEKKSNGPKIGDKGRKLFEEENQRSESEQVNSLLDESAKVPALQKESAKVPALQEVNSLLDESAKVPALQKESAKVPALQEESAKVPALQEVNSLLDESAKVPALQEVNSLLDGSAKVPALQKQSAKVPALQEEEFISDLSKAIILVKEEILPPVDIKDTESSETVEVVSPHVDENHSEVAFINNTSNVTNLFDEGQIMKENKSSLVNEGASPPISERLRELSNSLKSLCSSTPLCITMPSTQVSTDIVEPKTPTAERSLRWEVPNITSPQELFTIHSTGMKKSLVKEHLKFLNSANKEELKGLKGIGEKRATYILELRQNSPEYFKDLDDLKDVGLSEKQIKGMMKKVAGDMFT